MYYLFVEAYRWGCTYFNKAESRFTAFCGLKNLVSACFPSWPHYCAELYCLNSVINVLSRIKPLLLIFFFFQKLFPKKSILQFRQLFASSKALLSWSMPSSSQDSSRVPLNDTDEKNCWILAKIIRMLPNPEMTSERFGIKVSNYKSVS